MDILAARYNYVTFYVLPVWCGGPPRISAASLRKPVKRSARVDAASGRPHEIEGRGMQKSQTWARVATALVDVKECE